MTGGLLQLLGTMPLFWPGALLSTVAAGVCAPRVARRLGTGRVSSYCLVLALGGIAVTGLLTDTTPVPGDGRHPGAGFATSWRLPGPADLAGLDQRTVAMLLFVPLGVAVARARPVRRALRLAGAAAALPFAIEWVQFEVVWLLRPARAQDIADSLCGLLLGLVLGVVAPAARRTRTGAPDRADGCPSPVRRAGMRPEGTAPSRGIRARTAPAGNRAGSDVSRT